MEVITAALSFAAALLGLGLLIAHLFWGKASSGTFYLGLFLVCGVIVHSVLTYFGVGPAVPVVDTPYARGSAVGGKIGSVIGFLIGLSLILKGLRAPDHDPVLTRIVRLTALVLASLAVGAAIPTWMAVKAMKAEHLAKGRSAELEGVNSRLIEALSQAAPNPAALFRVDDPKLLESASPWETWRYPGSQGGSEPTFGEVGSPPIKFGVTQRISLVTRDEFEKVWAFYQEKCQILERFEFSEYIPAPSGTGAAGQSIFKLVNRAPANSFSGPPSDALSARAFTVHSLRYQLVGFIYRPSEAKTTTILLAYRPNTEFVSLLKDRVVKD